MDKELNKLVAAEIERVQELNYLRAIYNYDEEVTNAENSMCCEECEKQAAYFI